MAAGDEKDLIEAVVTCEGNLDDPDFQDRFHTLVNSLKTALYISKTKDPFRVRKIEPWNSVRVTISIPKEAAQKLKLLAQQGSNVLRSMGILSVQVEGDQVISLTWAAQNNEATQVILRQTNDNELPTTPSLSSGTSGISSSSSLPASSPTISSISSSVASISSPIPLTPGPSSSSSSSATSIGGGGGGGDSLVAHLDMLSSSSSSCSSSQSSSSAAAAVASAASLSFHRSPNVVAPGSEPIPVLPPKQVGPTSLATSSRGPFPFVSMTHAAQAAMIQRSSGGGGGIGGEMSPMTMMSVINNNLNSSGSGSNAANSTNSIVVASSSSPQQNSKPIMHPPTHQLQQQQQQHQQSNQFPVTSSLNNHPHGQYHPHHHPPPPPGALVIVSSSSSSAFSNVNSNSNISSVGGGVGVGVKVGSELNNLNALVSHPHPPSQQTPHQSHQSLQHVNVPPPPPYPPSPHPHPLGGGGGSGVNQSSNHLSNLSSSSPLHHLHQQQLQLNQRHQHPQTPVRATLQISSDGSSSSMALQQLQQLHQQHQQQQQVSTSPLLVNLLQNQQNDGPSQSPGPVPSTSSSSAPSASADPAYNQQKFLLQQQQLKKTKRGQSLDGASGGTLTTPTTPSTTPTDPYQFTLPSDHPSSSAAGPAAVLGGSLSRPVSVPNSTATSSSALIHQSHQGRTTIVHHPQQASLRSPAPPQQPPSYPLTSSSTITGETSNLTAHQNFPTSLPNGPHHQNLATVTLVEHNASSSAPCAADQSSRTLLPITTSVNIVSNKSPLSNKSSSTANLVNSKDSSAPPPPPDSKTFIPPLDPRLSSSASMSASQVQKIVSSSSLPQGKNSQDAASIAKSSTSHLQNQQGRTTALLQQNRRLSTSSKDGRGPSPFPPPSPGGGKPRQFLINPLTGHLEPMPPSLTGAGGGGGAGGGDGDGNEEIETGKMSKGGGFHHSRNKVGKPPQLGTLHRQIVTTETGVTVARVIKSEDISPSSAVSSSIAQSSMGAGAGAGGEGGDISSSVISVSKKSRVDDNSVTTAALNSQKDPSLKPASPTVTATSVVGEKIKLRLKLEKSEPISPAYKVDVSFVKKSEKVVGVVPGSPGGSSSPSPSTAAASTATATTADQVQQQPRVPPLHISLRGKNAAVVVSPRREETKDKEMPPPPSSVSGSTKETSSSLVISQHPKDLSSSMESSKSAMSSSSSHHHLFLNSHDGSKSTTKLEKKRAKSRVKSFDGSSSVEKRSGSGSGKMSRPKLSKEVSSGSVMMSRQDGKETHLTMPVLQPAVTLPSVSLPVLVTTEGTTKAKNKSSLASSSPSLLPTMTPGVVVTEAVIKSEAPNLIVHKITTSNNNVNVGGAPTPKQPPPKVTTTITETVTKVDSLKPPVLLSSSSPSSSSSCQAVPPPATSTSSQDLRPVEKKDEVKSSSQTSGDGGGVVEIRKVPPPPTPAVVKIKLESEGSPPSLPPPPVIPPSPVPTTVSSVISKGGDDLVGENSPQLDKKIDKDQQLPPPPPVPLQKTDDTNLFKGAFSSLSTSKSSSPSPSLLSSSDIPVGGGSSLTKVCGAGTRLESTPPLEASSSSSVVVPSSVTKPVNSPKNVEENVPTPSEEKSSSPSSKAKEDESVVSPVISLSTATTVSCDIINTTTITSSTGGKSESTEQRATNTTSGEAGDSEGNNGKTTTLTMTGFDGEKNKKVEISQEVDSSKGGAEEGEVSCTGATSKMTTNTTSEIGREEQSKLTGEMAVATEKIEEGREEENLEIEMRRVEEVIEPLTVTPNKLAKMDIEKIDTSQDGKSEITEKADKVMNIPAKPVAMAKVIDIDNPFKALMVSGTVGEHKSLKMKEAVKASTSEVLEKKENQQQCNADKVPVVVVEEEKVTIQTKQQQQQPQLPILNRIHHDNQLVQNEKEDESKKEVEGETSKEETRVEMKVSQNKMEAEVKVNEVPVTAPVAVEAAVESDKPVQVEAAQQPILSDTKDLPKVAKDDIKTVEVNNPVKVNEDVKAESSIKEVEPSVVKEESIPVAEKQVDEIKLEDKKEVKNSENAVPVAESKLVEEEGNRMSSIKVEEPQKVITQLPIKEDIQSKRINSPTGPLEEGKVTSGINEHKVEEQLTVLKSVEVESPKKSVVREEKSESVKEKECLESSEEVKPPKNQDSSSILPSKVAAVSKEAPVEVVEATVPPPKNTLPVETTTEVKSNDTKINTPPQHSDSPVEKVEKKIVPELPKVVKVSLPIPAPISLESKPVKQQKMENHEVPKENAVHEQNLSKSVEEPEKMEEKQNEKEISRQVDVKINSEPQVEEQVESVKEKVISKESVKPTPVQQAVADVKVSSTAKNKSEDQKLSTVTTEKEVEKVEDVENVELAVKKNDEAEKMCKASVESDPVQVSSPPASTSQVIIREIHENKVENISSVEEKAETSASTSSISEPSGVDALKKEEEDATAPLLVSVNLPPVPKLSVEDTSSKTSCSPVLVDEIESYTENDVNVKVITQTTQDHQSGGNSSTSNTPPPISIVLPSSAVDGGGGKGAPPAKNTYKRRAEIKPGALQNTLKRLHDNFFPKVLKTSEQQDASTQSRQLAEEEAAAAEQAIETEKPMKSSPSPTATVTNESSAATQVNSTPQPPAPLPPNLRPSVSIPLPQMRQVPNIIAHQRPRASNSTVVSSGGGIPTSSILVSTATLSSATFTSVVSSTTGSPQTVFAIHPNVSIPANFAQLHQHSSSHPMVLPGGHKMVPIKLVTLPKQHGGHGPIQTIPLGGSTPNRSSPNLLEAVNIVANAGSRSSSPKTTLIGNTVQTTPLNLSSMSLPVGSNLHFVPISVSSGTGTTGNVKVLMTQPIKMQQGQGGMVLKSMVMGNNPTTIRVIRPANLQDSIGLQSLIKSQGHGKQDNATGGTTALVVNNVEVGGKHQNQSSKSLESSVLQISNADAAQAATAVVVGVTSAPMEKNKNVTTTEILTIQSDSLFKKLDGVEIVDTGSPLNNDDLPFEADIIHDEKDLADVLAAEATENDEVIGNCVVENFHRVASTASATVQQMKVKEEKEKPVKKQEAAATAAVASQNHVGSRRFLKIDKTVDSSHFPTMMRINSPLYTYSSAGAKGKSRGLNIVTAAAPTPVSRSPSPLDAPASDLHGEDEEIINSFSRSPSQPRLSPQQNAALSAASKGPPPPPPQLTNCDKNSSNSSSTSSSTNSLGQELSIEIPPIDMEVNSGLSPHHTQLEKEGKRCTRSTRSNPRLSPDITAFVSETTSSKPAGNKLSGGGVGGVKGEMMALRNSPKPSPTGSVKVLSPTPSSLTITPSTSTRSSPILHSQQQQQISASNAAATINAVAMGIIDKIQGNATAQNVKNARISKLSQGGNKRKRQESDSSSASRDENMEDKVVEVDLNSRPGKRKCSENAAEMIKVCIGVEDSPKRNSSVTSSSSSASGGSGGGSKKTEDGVGGGGGNGNSKGKEGGGGKGGKKQMTILMEEDDDADSEVSFTRERSGRSSRESSEDRSSSRGSSAQRIVAAAAAAMAAAEKIKSAKEDESGTKEPVKSGRLNTRVLKGTPGKSKSLGKITNTPVKNAKESAVGGAAGKGTPTGGRRVNRVSKVNSAKSKASPLTPAKTRTNFRKDGTGGGGGGAGDKGGNLSGGGGAGGVAEKHLTNVSGSTGSGGGGGGGGGGGAAGQVAGSTPAPGENENAARRKTRSSAAGKRHAT